MTVSQEKKNELPVTPESVTWGDVTWVNIEQPTKAKLDYLAQHYPFHPLDLEDCLSVRQQPKLDEYPDYLFLVFHFSVWDKETRVSRYDQVSVFVGDKYLVTVHSGRLKPLASLFQQCRTDEGTRQQYFSYGSGYLLYRILDMTVEAYFPILNSILSWINDVEDAVYDENIPLAQEIATLRRDIVTQRRIIYSLRGVTAESERKIRRFSKLDVAVQFGDLMDHLNKICEALDEAKEVVEIFKDTDFVLSTERLNRIMRVLTVLGSIILPFLAISGIYGMNIPLPGGLERGSFHTFIILVGGMLLISGSMLIFFRRQRWI